MVSAARAWRNVIDPLVKAAAFSYGARKAASARRPADGPTDLEPPHDREMLPVALAGRDAGGAARPLSAAAHPPGLPPVTIGSSLIACLLSHDHMTRNRAIQKACDPQRSPLCRRKNDETDPFAALWHDRSLP